MCLVRILLAFVLTACSLAGFAQTGGDVYVEGRVSNSEGKALLNVTCKLLDKRDSLLAYSFTDKNGEYRYVLVTIETKKPYAIAKTYKAEEWQLRI